MSRQIKKDLQFRIAVPAGLISSYIKDYSLQNLIPEALSSSIL